MVAIPAIMEAGSEAKFCASLMQPNETLVMTVSLVFEEKNTILFQETSNQEFHRCVQFQAPHVGGDVIQNIKVEVRGETYQSTELRKVLIRSYHPTTFVQTDKPIYLPGQTVQFRIITLDSKFRPVNELYNIVEIEDIHNNRIGQWVNTTSNGKILQLSHPLNAKAPQGTYDIVVWINEKKIYHTFKVEKYVLPKFEVKVDVSEEISIKQEEFKAEICAKYTYGQPVPGTVEVDLCRPLQRYTPILMRITVENPEGIPEFTAPCIKETKETDKTGCATFTFSMSTFTKAGHKMLTDKLYLNSKVVEEGTGTTQPQGKTITLTYIVGKLSFIETPKVYEHGSTVEGKVKVVYFNNTPIADKMVHLFVGERWVANLLQNLTTDSEGIARFSLKTSTMPNVDIHLIVNIDPILGYRGYKSPYYEMGEHTISLVQPFTPFTKSVSSLNVKKKEESLRCGGKAEITIQYTVVGETSGPVDVMYLVLSRATIVKQGLLKANVEDSPVTEGEVSFILEVSPEMAPLVQVLAYAILPSETVIAHSADFATEKCFSHKVLLEFSPSAAVPGEGNTMKLTAQPGSLCGLSAVDQSVLIKEPGKKLNADMIFEFLPVIKASHIPYQVEDPEECLHVRPRRYVMPYPSDEKNAYSVFKNLGLKVATNLMTRPPSCLMFKGRRYSHDSPMIVYSYHHPEMSRVAMPLAPGPVGAGAGAGVVGAGAGGRFDEALPPLETVRTFFPETWIWDIVEVGESGQEDVPVTVPDTITTWETETFCLSPEGFGLAPPRELTVFQPFFLELSLPYSIIRGEHFELKATVFSYLASCIRVVVTPAPSEGYTLTPLSGDHSSFCLCDKERKTLSWKMAPTVLGVVNVSLSAEAGSSDIPCGNEIVTVPARGRIDVVTRPLIVKAEGTEQEKSYSWLLCPRGTPLTEKIYLQLPLNVIDGSARASLSVLGDILGRALKNLDGMLRMPYGCGEQNMALLAPNIYILEYLRNTGQLTAAIKEKTAPFLTGGYQRQLNYKHPNGAYSTFGREPGNTWLSAFVLRTFARAKSFTYIDPSVIDRTKTWLESKQRDDGCFEKSGSLFNNRMKGGVSDELTLTAYVTTAFLEMGISPSHEIVNRSLSCLRSSLHDLRNTYTTALLAYTFSLAGETQIRRLLLDHLDNIALQEGGHLHWSQTSTETTASLSVEISSYVILASLSHQPDVNDLGYAARIVRWLAAQQNPYGGFSSTQDTVVALQALALYSSLVYQSTGSSTVTVVSPSGQLTFDVNENNKLLYQERELQDVSGKYSLEVKGTACASIQMAVHYHVPTPTTKTSLSVEAEPEADCTSNNLRAKVTLKLKSLYSGKEKTTNMVIVDIKLLSGFVPDNLEMLRTSLLVDNIDRKDDHVLIYLRELPSGTPINHQIDLVQDVPIQNLKPAVVKIYDYYQPSDQAEAEYVFPCATGE